jgi:hypothetical protein
LKVQRLVDLQAVHDRWRGPRHAAIVPSRH